MARLVRSLCSTQGALLLEVGTPDLQRLFLPPVNTVDRNTVMLKKGTPQTGFAAHLSSMATKTMHSVLKVVGSHQLGIMGIPLEIRLAPLVDKGYVEVNEETRTIRGRIDFNTSTKRFLFQKARAQCWYD